MDTDSQQLLTPLISCIMPTANRRAFLPQALALFAAQDYPHTELIILDDGEDSVADLIPAQANIRYQRLPQRLSIGAKRNLACELAQGDFIAHWDDDDWYAPTRLSQQLAALQASRGAVICGLDRVLFYDPLAQQAWEYRYPPNEPAWAYGATLLYRRDWWRQHRFDDVMIGEDNRFVWQASARQVLRLADGRWYVGRVHAGNTSSKNTGDQRWHAIKPASLPHLARDSAAPPAAGCRVGIGIICDSEPQRLLRTLACLQPLLSPNLALLLLPDMPDAAMSAQLAALPHYPQLDGAAHGHAACFNRLLAHGQHDVCILLEAGATPAGNWLAILLAVLQANPAIGVFGPSSNRAWNMQRQCAGCVDDAVSIEAAAASAARQHGLHWVDNAPLYCLGDFCYGVTRALINTIGGADEGFGAGPCWEMEYSARAARAGFDVAWVPGAFVFRPAPGERRCSDEQRFFEASKQRYQDALCGRRLRQACRSYEAHCQGEACGDFAPESLITLQRPLPRQTRIDTPALPLVSCVMPTRGRPQFVAQALHYFERQDYPNKQLIVVGDRVDDVPAALLQHPLVKFVAAGSQRSVGYKRNLACETAQGEIVLHWDDDDWYAADRISRQLAPLLRREAEICGLTAEDYFDLARWSFWRCSLQLHQRMYVRNVAGGTLAFRRKLWLDGVRYPDVSLAEDAAFLNLAIRGGARLQVMSGRELLIYLRHSGNTWRFQCGDFLDRRGWLQIEEPDCFSADRTFYLPLSAAVQQRSLSTH